MASYPPDGSGFFPSEIASILQSEGVITSTEATLLNLYPGPAIYEAYIIWKQDGASKITVKSANKLDTSNPDITTPGPYCDYYRGRSPKFSSYNNKLLYASWLSLNGSIFPSKIFSDNPENYYKPGCRSAGSTTSASSANTPTAATTAATNGSTATVGASVAVPPAAPAPATPAPTAGPVAPLTTLQSGTTQSGVGQKILGSGGTPTFETIPGLSVTSSRTISTPSPPSPPPPPATAPTPVSSPQAQTTGSAADERIEAQCILIDYISTLSQDNYKWRKSTSNNKDFYDLATANGGGGTQNYYMIGMKGDGEDFSSLINGSQLKGKFLDFTTAQLSSLTPVVKLYKVQQIEDGSTIDYLIPFPTHAGWLNAKSNTGQVLKNDLQSLNVFDPSNQSPINVGLKSFDWQFEGSNPVSSKVDIKAKLVLFAKSLSDLVEEFDVFNFEQSTPQDKQIQRFKYADLILRSGKKFTDAKQYDPKYYKLKIQIGWKTENTKLFDQPQRDSLEVNTTTLSLTLVDHSFSFDQDGSVTLTVDYRAYTESVLASQDADFIRTYQQQVEVDTIRNRLYIDNKILSSDPSDPNSRVNQSDIDAAKKSHEEATKKYQETIDRLNQEAFASIINELNDKGAIYYIQVNAEAYAQAKRGVKISSGLTQIEIDNINTERQRLEAQIVTLKAERERVAKTTTPSVGPQIIALNQQITDAVARLNALPATSLSAATTTFGNVLNKKPAPSALASAAIKAIGSSNTDLSSLVPEEQDGYKTVSFFYLGDLFAIAIRRMYQKMSIVTYTDDNGIQLTKPETALDKLEKPKFIFGSALFRDAKDTTSLTSVNILDVPVSVEWFTEWFANEIISQQREIYPLLYFIRDLSSKIIDNLVNSYCDKSGALRSRNKINTLLFPIVKFDGGDDAIVTAGVAPLDDLPVDPTLSSLVNAVMPKFGQTQNLQEYIAIYCQDRRAPPKIDCEVDERKGRYHFYFGKDRGLVKKINFTRTQTIGLRELNYVRESSGLGLEQLMTPYDLEITMVGNNLMFNGMMIFINPSGFGRKIGQPDDPNSISYKLKLGGYHLVYRVENMLGLDGFETRVKAKWIGSGYSSPLVKGDSGNIYGSNIAVNRKDI